MGKTILVVSNSYLIGSFFEDENGERYHLTHNGEKLSIINIKTGHPLANSISIIWDGELVNVPGRVIAQIVGSNWTKLKEIKYVWKIGLTYH